MSIWSELLYAIVKPILEELAKQLNLAGGRSTPAEDACTNPAFAAAWRASIIGRVRDVPAGPGGIRPAG
jgi:hypothetical protein